MQHSATFLPRHIVTSTSTGERGKGDIYRCRGGFLSFLTQQSLLFNMVGKVEHSSIPVSEMIYFPFNTEEGTVKNELC